MEGDFGDLIDCAVKYGCLGSRRRVMCANCTEKGAYVHGGCVWDRIEVCDGNWTCLGQEERHDVLLEEAYRALTICDRGTRCHALDEWEETVNAIIASNPALAGKKKRAMCATV
jgi:hypothetical protein